MEHLCVGLLLHSLFLSPLGRSVSWVSLIHLTGEDTGSGWLRRLRAAEAGAELKPGRLIPSGVLPHNPP